LNPFSKHVTETPAFNYKMQQRNPLKVESSVIFEIPETAQAVQFMATQPVQNNVILGVPLIEN